MSSINNAAPPPSYGAAVVAAAVGDGGRSVAVEGGGRWRAVGGRGRWGGGFPVSASVNKQAGVAADIRGSGVRYRLVGTGDHGGTPCTVRSFSRQGYCELPLRTAYNAELIFQPEGEEEGRVFRPSKQQ